MTPWRERRAVGAGLLEAAGEARSPHDYDPGSNVVDVQIGYLRREPGSESIETVRWMGYRLTT